jgi:hypothetical protein
MTGTAEAVGTTGIIRGTGITMIAATDPAITGNVAGLPTAMRIDRSKGAHPLFTNPPKS